MPTNGRPSITKRNREQSQRDRQKEKAERRNQRATEKQRRSEARERSPDEDPDLAGIVPGPQPRIEE